MVNCRVSVRLPGSRFFKNRLNMAPEEQLKLIKEHTVEIIKEEELFERLKKKGKLRIKLGIDASGPDIHLGFAVVLRKLRQFQDLEHTAVLIVGDFTGKIGDPSGRSKTRPQLTDAEIRNNITRYREQIFKILRPDRTEFRFNSEWLGALKIDDLVRLSSHYTVARMLERDDFSYRLKDNIPIFMHEILYPLLQAQDSIAVNADVEIGGTDQKFNLIVGRELMKEFGLEPQIVLTMPLLEGLDGSRKMSKSFGNYIGITDRPEDMFGKIMSIPDDLIYKYYELCTDIFPHKLAEIKKELSEHKTNPRDIKFELARTIVRMYHSAEAAQRAGEEFDRVFRDRAVPEQMAEYSAGVQEIPIVDLLVDAEIFKSRSEAKRKIREGAVDVDGHKIHSPEYSLNLQKERVLRIGKRKFLRVKR